MTARRDYSNEAVRLAKAAELAARRGDMVAFIALSVGAAQLLKLARLFNEPAPSASVKRK